MGRIHALNPIVINKIAAGEVIERPASVAKELLENCLDACATRITVDVEQGGAELIRIVDDGQGIHPDDFELAVTSHATSKITTDDDLFRVQSMGFRGEALASIASVSRMHIRSRLPDADAGHELLIEGGVVQHQGPCGCPPGTSIEIRELFGNTPVRRRFLKKAGTEFGHLAEQFTRIAIANSRLHLVLTHNGKRIHELPATGSLLERLQIFYGGELCEHLLPVESSLGPHRLWGFVAHPSQTRSTRKNQYLFLNGRYIQDRALQHALSEAYRGLVMTGRHPVVFLFLEMPADEVDVNVHPTKAEVRFRDSQQPYRQLLATLRSTFLKHDLDGTMTADRARNGAEEESETAAEDAMQPVGSGEGTRNRLQSELVDWAKQELQNWKPTERIAAFPPVERPPGETDREPSLVRNGEQNGSTETDSETWAEPVPTAERSEQHQPTHNGQSVSPATAVPSGSRVLQVNDCYLVTETEAGLVVIDQHALHERILYEQFRQRILAGSVESQRLLVPDPLELSTREASLLLDHQDVMAELGFVVEDFGGGTVLVAAYPAMLKRQKVEGIVRDLLEELDRPGKAPDRRDLLDTLMHTMACRAAIKSGQRLSSEEIESLLALRHLVDDAHHCPHGRPTALVLSREELDRQFGRLGAH